MPDPDNGDYGMYTAGGWQHISLIIDPAEADPLV
jgi:hypothetical protein